MQTKPRRPFLQRGHPLARKLALALPFGEGGGSRTQDLTGKHLATLTSSATWTVGRDGPAVQCGSAVQVTRHADDLFTGPFTVLFRFKAPNGGGDQMLLRLNDSFAANAAWIYYRGSGNNLHADLFDSGAGAAIFDSAAVSPGEWLTAVYVYRGSSHEWWVNGKLSATQAAGTRSNTTTTLALGANNDGSQPLNQPMSAVLIWRRALVGADIRRVSLDPWQLFRPAAVPTALQSVGGGGGAAGSLWWWQMFGQPLGLES
jgi:hypothetical protein